MFCCEQWLTELQKTWGDDENSSGDGEEPEFLLFFDWKLLLINYTGIPVVYKGNCIGMTSTYRVMDKQYSCIFLL